MKKILAIILLVISSQMAISQSIAGGVKHLLAGNRKQALSVFENVLRQKKNSAEGNYFIGLTHYLNRDYEKAIPYLKSAAKSNFKTNKTGFGAIENANFLLARTYFLSYRFSQAVEVLEAMAKRPDLHQFKKSDTVEDLLTRAQRGQRMLAEYQRNPYSTTIIDTVVIDKKDFLRVYPQNNTIGYLSATYDSTGSKLKEFTYTTGKGDSRIISKPNGDNGFDIFLSNKYLSGWSRPEPIQGKINTKYNECYAIFPHYENYRLLYFSSDNREESLGGYDMFLSHPDSEGEYRTPRALGMPFNSPFNDYLMVMNQLEAPGAGTGFGYFASDRYLPDGKIAVYAFLLSPPHNPMFDSLMTKSNKNPSEIVFYPDEETKSKFREKINKIFSSCNVSHTSDKKDIRIEQTKDFTFVVKGTTYYSKYTDFRTEEGLHKFRELQNIEATIEKTKTDLANNRVKYAQEIDKKTKEALGRSIQDAENQLKTLIQETQRLTKEIRRIENDAR